MEYLHRCTEAHFQPPSLLCSNVHCLANHVKRLIAWPQTFERWCTFRFQRRSFVAIGQCVWTLSDPPLVLYWIQWLRFSSNVLTTSPILLDLPTTSYLLFHYPVMSTFMGVSSNLLFLSTLLFVSYMRLLFGGSGTTSPRWTIYDEKCIKKVYECLMLGMKGLSLKGYNGGFCMDELL